MTALSVQNMTQHQIKAAFTKMAELVQSGVDLSEYEPHETVKSVILSCMTRQKGSDVDKIEHYLRGLGCAVKLPFACHEIADLFLQVGFTESEIFQGKDDLKSEVIDLYYEIASTVVWGLYFNSGSLPVTKIKNDSNGNPRYVLWYGCLSSLLDRATPLTDKYSEAVSRSKSFGGARYRSKSYGGGIVFSSYNVSEILPFINAYLLPHEQYKAVVID